VTEELMYKNQRPGRAQSGPVESTGQGWPWNGPPLW